MAQQKVEMIVHTCDGCGRERVEHPNDGEPPEGYHGSVLEISSSGGAGGEFYACRKSCIKNAITNVVERSWNE